MPKANVIGSVSLMDFGTSTTANCPLAYRTTALSENV
ncbi:hypothetical protein SAMN05443668_103117 [Cryptosporangium aurantiacum]|uniref:Uncharacterized protein n=1 Tax=Cryptosporangium aurantiacum TaxID=134849 RepID=A0A1M7PAG5_9ACTN|nr:hypothetical protein SAMN05443668_103117 [Cryptosporangium aurantiacum]